MAQNTPSPNSEQSIEQLQEGWKTMFQKTLPTAAISRSAAQPKWPVHVDHCFARIILDKVVGIDTPWMDKIKSPAYKNMSREQLVKSIELGESILKGGVDLVDLDASSLELRGKSKKGGKRKRSDDEEGENAKKRSPAPRPKEEKVADGKAEDEGVEDKNSGEQNSPKVISSIKVADKEAEIEDLTPYLKKIALCDKTKFQKLVLTTLCQVPRGQYTTYAAISNHLSSSPRAVGNALKNNPFAPQVPCHRVLASGGGIGGFHGSWGKKGEEGLHDRKKRELLRKEGVRFDGKGRVAGSPWTGFK